MKKLILCDLDNTLLPLHTQEKFVELWFRDIAVIFAAYGIDPALAAGAMDDGCRAMIFNDGRKKNLDVFYDVACAKSGCTRGQLESVIDRYYATTFSNVKQLTQANPYALRIARLMRRQAEYAVIATMPMFPIEACDARLRWTGLNAGMFDLVTTCDFSSYCKPNPLYYTQIMERFGVGAKDALMIGNDVREDMEPCEKLGVDTFLVTEHLLDHGRDYARFRQGGYPELIAFLETV